MGAFPSHSGDAEPLLGRSVPIEEVRTLFKKDKPVALSGGKIDTVLGAGTSYNGTLKSDGNLRIDGTYQGQIETAGNLIVGASAKVLADIKANSVQVWGAVRGDITAQGRLEILPGGRVWGDIEVAALLIDEGGIYRGQCVMGGAQLEQTGLLEAGAQTIDVNGAEQGHADVGQEPDAAPNEGEANDPA